MPNHATGMTQSGGLNHGFLNEEYQAKIRG